MVALRSRRLEAIFGAALDRLEHHNVESLVANHTPEAFDLDFKATLYDNSEKGRRDLATDVAALANTSGGLLVLGIAEDKQARAVAAPGVPLSDDELSRVLNVVGTHVVPLPVFEPFFVRKPGIDDHGFLVIAVLRTPLAPHAVIVNRGLRYPRRNGTTTRYLSEPEVASEYRERLAGAQRQAARVEEIEQEALRRLDMDSDLLPWVVVSLVPDVAGDLFIDGSMFAAFRQEIVGAELTIIPSATRFRRASVGRRRLLADGTMNESPPARWLSVELHTDGSGICAIAVPGISPVAALRSEGQPTVHRIHDEALAIAVASGVHRLAQHARDRAAAGGSALIRAQIYPISPGEQARLVRVVLGGFMDQLGDRTLTTPQPAAEAVADLDGLAQLSRVLIEASAQLVNEIGQAFGVAEMSQLSRVGQLRRMYWRADQMFAWAEQHGIEITDDTVG